MPLAKLLALKNNIYARTALAILAAILVYKFYVWTKTEVTDNAYVEADISLVSSQVSGVVTHIFCSENQQVAVGDILAEIDDTDYKAGLEKAIFTIEAASQDIKATMQKIDIEQINIEQLTANLRFAENNYAVALKDYNRTSQLASDHFSSRKILETSKITSEKAKLEVSQAKFDLESAVKNLELLKMQKSIDEANLAGLIQSKVIAENAWNNTKIRADINGVITNIGMKTGNFVKTGQTLAAIVPIDKLYIKANFKETQVTKFSIGAKAYIAFDGISGLKLKGWVRSISPAAGSKFSLIPPDNATGNFTKVVQRFPVIIDFKAPEDVAKLIKAGMSVVVSIRR